MVHAAHVNVSFEAAVMAYFKEFKCHGADIRHVRIRYTHEATATVAPHICFVVCRSRNEQNNEKKIN